jgi:hypothetical protein
LLALGEMNLIEIIIEQFHHLILGMSNNNYNCFIGGVDRLIAS